MGRLITLIFVCWLAASTFGCNPPDDLAGTDVPSIELPGDDKSDSFELIDPATCPGGAPRLVDGLPAAWTLIHYAAADNNLERVIVEDINEMELGHQGSPNVNVLVQLDRRSEQGVWRYEIQPDSDMETLNSQLVGFSEEEPDSGDHHTLAAFGIWAATCYPAESYMVVIGGHGDGWSAEPEEGSDDENRAAPPARLREQHRRAQVRGESLRMIAPDSTNGTEIHIDQLAEALEAIQRATRRDSDPSWVNRLVAYGSDACLMGTIEVAYDLRNAVTYLIGSEETEPGQGWPYTTIVRSLTTQPFYYSDRPHELAAEVVDAYGRSYDPGGAADQRSFYTMAAFDTAAVIRVRNRLDRMASLLLELVELEPGTTAALGTVRSDLHSFGDGYVDVGQMLTRLRAQLITAGLMPEVREHWTGDERFRDLRNVIDELLEEELPEMILAARASERFEEVWGLSVFMPVDGCGWGLDVDSYGASAFAEDTEWDELLLVLTGLVGEGAADVEASGSGTMDIDMPGVVDTTHAVEATCDLREGMLYVYVAKEAACIQDITAGTCTDPPRLSLDIDVSGEKPAITQAYLWNEEPLLDLSLADIHIDLDEPQALHQSYYSGTAVLPFVVDDTEQPLTVSFVCQDFEIDYCESYDFWW